MHDIFISYSRKDKVIVDTFVEKFEQSGFTCWMDRTGIETGDAFRRQIVQAIREARIIVFFSSENSNKSEWTEKEINTAIHFKKQIIPVKLDKSSYADSVLFDLIGLDYIDYTVSSLKNSVTNKLLHTLKIKLGIVEVADGDSLKNDDSKEPCNQSLWKQHNMLVNVGLIVQTVAYMLCLSVELWMCSHYGLTKMFTSLMPIFLILLTLCTILSIALTYGIYSKRKWCVPAIGVCDFLSVYLICRIGSSVFCFFKSCDRGFYGIWKDLNYLGMTIYSSGYIYVIIVYFMWLIVLHMAIIILLLQSKKGKCSSWSLMTWSL